MENIKNVIESEKIIVIVRGIDSDKLLPLAEAMYEGGIRLLEITYSADGKVSDEQTAKNIEMLAKNLSGKMYIGAGTVLNERQVELTAKAGGKFIISPDTDCAVIKKTKELGLISMPGAVTPSEIKQCHLAGADYIKIFPAVNLGPEYIKAVRAPLCNVKYLAVGGINTDNIKDYLSVGVSGFGIGGNIVSKKQVDAGNFAEITALAKKYVSAVHGE